MVLTYRILLFPITLPSVGLATPLSLPTLPSSPREPGLSHLPLPAPWGHFLQPSSPCTLVSLVGPASCFLFATLPALMVSAKVVGTLSIMKQDRALGKATGLPAVQESAKTHQNLLASSVSCPILPTGTSQETLAALS